MKYDISITEEQLLSPMLDDSGYDIAAGTPAMQRGHSEVRSCD